jgi:hypothetical protein
MFEFSHEIQQCRHSPAPPPGPRTSPSCPEAPLHCSRVPRRSWHPPVQGRTASFRWRPGTRRTRRRSTRDRPIISVRTPSRPCQGVAGDHHFEDGNAPVPAPSLHLSREVPGPIVLCSTTTVPCPAEASSPCSPRTTSSICASSTHAPMTSQRPASSDRSLATVAQSSRQGQPQGARALGERRTLRPAAHGSGGWRPSDGPLHLRPRAIASHFSARYG